MQSVSPPASEVRVGLNLPTSVLSPQCVPELESHKTAALAVDGDDDGRVSPGDTLLYTITLRNTAEECQPITNIVFTDTPGANTRLVAGSAQTTYGSVAVGNGLGDTRVEVTISDLYYELSEAFIVFRVTVDNPLPAGVISVSNQGEFTSNELPPVLTDDPATAEDDDPTITPVFAAPKLSATKQGALYADHDNNGLITRGDELQYTVRISNTGNMDAAGITYDDTPDPNTPLLTGTVTTTRGTVVSGNGATDQAVSVLVGTLPAGGGAIITYRTIIDPAMPPGVGQVTNQGVVSGAQITTPIPTDDPDQPPGTPTIITVRDPGLLRAVKYSTLAIDDDGDEAVSPGDTLRYTIRISNTGGEAVTNTLFTDTPDPRTSLVVGSVGATQGSVVLGNTAGDETVSIDIGTVLPGITDTVTISFLVVIANPFPPGDERILNQGVIDSSSGITVTYSDDETSTGPGPTPTPVTVRPLLSISSGPIACVLPGTTLDVAWAIANTGNGALMSSTLTSNVSGSGSGSTVMAIGTLPAQSAVTVTQTVMVSQPVAYGAEAITVTATVLTATRELLIPICAPDFRASSASVTAEQMYAAESFTYTWHLRNTGNADALGVDAAFTPTNVPLYSFISIVSVTGGGNASWDPLARQVNWQGDLPVGHETTVVFLAQSTFGLSHTLLVSPFEVEHPWRPTFYGDARYQYPYKLYFMIVLNGANPYAR
jgi:uncharacterized repeat protein (TIGR01451 family)